MIIGGTHWLLAVVIALVIHLAGVLWLSLPQPVRQPLTDRAGESFAVTLGPDADRATTDVSSITPEDSTDIGATVEVARARPETTSGAEAPPVTVEAASTPVIVNPATTDTARPVEPSAVGEVADTGADALTPAPADSVETANAGEPADAGVPSPEIVVARKSTESKPATMEVVEVGTTRVTSRETIRVSPGQAETVEARSQAESPASPESVATVPTAAAEETPAPTSSDASVTAAPTPAPVSQIATTGTDALDVPTPSPDAAAAVDEAETVEVDQASPARQTESAAVAPAEQPDVEVASARSPDTEVATASEPDVREAVQPEVMDLQALQESGGGSGVVARYAGVLKGWLRTNMHYPRAARLAGQEGEVVVRFVIDRNGIVQSVVVESESGFPLLDREAREMIERGNPFPPIPDGMPGPKLEVRVPVNFHVRDETVTKEIPPIYLE